MAACGISCHYVGQRPMSAYRTRAITWPVELEFGCRVANQNRSLCPDGPDQLFSTVGTAVGSPTAEAVCAAVRGYPTCHTPKGRSDFHISTRCRRIGSVRQDRPRWNLHPFRAERRSTTRLVVGLLGSFHVSNLESCATGWSVSNRNIPVVCPNNFCDNRQTKPSPILVRGKSRR